MKTLSKIIIALILISNNALAQTGELPTNEIKVSTSWQDGQAIVSWETSREVNTSHFVIEKTTDGVHFEILETIEAGSSTYRQSSYVYEDAGEVNAYTQYRVSLITMEGSLISSHTNSDFANAFEK